MAEKRERVQSIIIQIKLKITTAISIYRYRAKLFISHFNFSQIAALKCFVNVAYSFIKYQGTSNAPNSTEDSRAKYAFVRTNCQDLSFACALPRESGRKEPSPIEDL